VGLDDIVGGEMETCIYIYAGLLQTITRGEGDVTAIPPEASLIVSEPEWFVMCNEAGSEQARTVMESTAICLRDMLRR